MALTLDPNPIEAQAALYNKACCHAFRFVSYSFIVISVRYFNFVLHYIKLYTGLPTAINPYDSVQFLRVKLFFLFIFILF